MPVSVTMSPTDVPGSLTPVVAGARVPSLATRLRQTSPAASSQHAGDRKHTTDHPAQERPAVKRTASPQATRPSYANAASWLDASESKAVDWAILTPKITTLSANVNNPGGVFSGGTQVSACVGTTNERPSVPFFASGPLDDP